MKKGVKILLIVLAVLLLGFFLMKIALDSLAGNIEVVQAVLPDTGSLADGSYVGEYTLGPVHVKAQVELEEGVLTGVQLLEHNNGLGKKAEVITARILEAQSLDVDCISGATVSSKCILKAVETALQG